MKQIVILLILSLTVFAEKRPNIIMIMADDLGYECLAVNGAAEYKTPNLDKMAADGMRFTHCYSQPICTPTRVKLMTGLSNKRNYERFGYLPENQITFANVLQKAGYATCIVGKWQLLGGLEGPNKFGFDEYCLWQLTRKRAKKSGHDSRFSNPQLEINGKEVDYNNGEYGPKVINDYACDFIRKNKDKPFLLYYPMLLTHCPFIQTPDSPDWDPKSPGSKSYKGDAKYFPDMVNYMDKMVGNLVKTLDELKISDNTLIMFIGDNGTDKPIVTKMKDGSKVKGMKGSMRDEGNHVPFIAKWPKMMKAGVVSDEMVDVSDFFPTMCEATGVKAPENLDGYSMVPMFNGKKHARKYAYVWYNPRGGPTGREFARTQRWKLYGDGKFFDMEKDPAEKSPIKVSELSEKNIAAHKMLLAGIQKFDGVRPDEVSNPPKKKKGKKKKKK